MSHMTFQLETVSCPSCINKIEGMLSKTKGIQRAEVRFNTSRVRVEFDGNIVSSSGIGAKIEKLGYRVLSGM
ncbi:heavy-metal-associated domain-containing protein [Paenibacillus senegalimassiliensis]|uniref:heavy-metal-associated domain-containing protein n=1 Tax=Paenibacillus senegalimassiliensis TaxID=1737426 RepID=UPI00073F8783|nr:heavy-metal-associated domain-containing protein [Paenibacillus senegalimassiliensis]